MGARPVLRLADRCLVLELISSFGLLNKSRFCLSHVFRNIPLSESRKEHSTTKKSSFWGGGGVALQGFAAFFLLGSSWNMVGGRNPKKLPGFTI